MYKRVYTLYVLECVDDQYYVGITSDMKRRYQQHSLGIGANFTARHRPIRIFDQVDIGEMLIEEAEKYEDARVIELIFAIGLNHVRGGKYFRGNTKHKKLRQDYKELDTRYKRASSRMPGLVKTYKPRAKRRDPWARQEVKARKELNRSAMSIAS